jgi:hypothetical protein
MEWACVNWIAVLTHQHQINKINEEGRRTFTWAEVKTIEI